ncbi:hypothetical protein CTheo_6757 [Ceratobasidium theobromae]|uniref:Uncharacterized protein n=1 Tax=Ceratobasidium theobromae TaxID=1582974 RepID=A0A5N5QEC3_9AGAM|nr:hypothetical protein CTheo_6757 [Ceratobasidium theobromae]
MPSAPLSNASSSSHLNDARATRHMHPNNAEDSKFGDPQLLNDELSIFFGGPPPSKAAKRAKVTKNDSMCTTEVSEQSQESTSLFKRLRKSTAVSSPKFN